MYYVYISIYIFIYQVEGVGGLKPYFHGSEDDASLHFRGGVEGEGALGYQLGVEPGGEPPNCYQLRGREVSLDSMGGLNFSQGSESIELDSSQSLANHR